MKNFANGMKNLETRRSHGFCGQCNKYTDALWERTGKKLQVFCEECGQIFLVDNNRFSSKIKDNGVKDEISSQIS
jgi:hypothetical protein